MLFRSQNLPVSISPRGVLAFTAAATNPAGRAGDAGPYVRFSETASFDCDGRDVRAGRKRLVRCGTPEAAAKLARMLEGLRRAGEADREEMVRHALDASLDATAIRERVEEWRKAVRPVRIWANVLVVSVFAGWPAVAMTVGLFLTWPALVAALAACMVGTAVTFRRANHALYPAKTTERTQRQAQVSVVPMSAMRAHDYLARPLLAGFHPLAVAKVLLVEADFTALAGRVVRDLAMPVGPVLPGESAEVREAEESFRAAHRAAVGDFLGREGHDPAAFMAPPAARDASSRSYCPRCHAQFVTEGGKCADCGGMTLKPMKGE